MKDKQVIPLDRAFLCSDCDCIGDDPRSCTKCSSQALLPLARVLRGPSDKGEVLSFRINA